MDDDVKGQEQRQTAAEGEATRTVLQGLAGGHHSRVSRKGL